MKNNKFSQAQNDAIVKDDVGGIRTTQFFHSADDRHLMPLFFRGFR